MLRLPAPVVPHSASLSPATATPVLSTPVPVSAPPTSLDECLFSISLVSVPLAVRFSVSAGCARRRSVSTYAAILVPLGYPSNRLPAKLSILRGKHRLGAQRGGHFIQRTDRVADAEPDPLALSVSLFQSPGSPRSLCPRRRLSVGPSTWGSS